MRQLESENHKLLNLLDIKDEQMELLAKVDAVHDSIKPRPTPKPDTPETASSKYSNNNNDNSNNNENNDSTNNKDASSPKKLETLDVYIVSSPDRISASKTFIGASTGNIFVTAFVEKLRNKYAAVIPSVEKLFETLDCLQSTANSNYNQNSSNNNSTQHSRPTSSNSPVVDYLPTPASISTPASINTPGLSESPERPSFGFNIPSRLLSDKLTTIYFNEWNCMFNIIDQTEFLDEYQLLMTELSTGEAGGLYDMKKGKDNIFIVTTLLVLALGSLATKEKVSASMAMESIKLDQEWKSAFTPHLQSRPSYSTLRALLLALLYSLHTGTTENIWQYRMMAVNMAQRLGLHRKLVDPALDGEEDCRNRLLWTTYSLDCFAAAQTGAPRLFNDANIECPLPAKGFNQPCELSVYQFSACLAKIIETLYTSKIKTHPYKTVVMLEDHLESWKRDLPAELKFEFVDGAPVAQSPSPVHQKSPLFLMFYHYARILIHLPALCSPPDNNTKRGSSTVSVIQSARLLLELFNYLKARNVTSTLPLNTYKASVLFGSMVLYGAIDYSKSGALLTEVRKTLSVMLTQVHAELVARRPGVLTPESFHLFEEICEILSSVTNNPAASLTAAGGSAILGANNLRGAEEKKKRKSVKKDAGKTPVAQKEPTPPPVVSQAEDSESLRYSAINDLLYLNTIASQKRKQQQEKQLQSVQTQVPSPTTAAAPPPPPVQQHPPSLPPQQPPRVQVNTQPIPIPKASDVPAMARNISGSPLSQVSPEQYSGHNMYSVSSPGIPKVYDLDGKPSGLVSHNGRAGNSFSHQGSSPHAVLGPMPPGPTRKEHLAAHNAASNNNFHLHHHHHSHSNGGSNESSLHHHHPGDTLGGQGSPGDRHLHYGDYHENAELIQKLFTEITPPQPKNWHQGQQQS